MKSILVGILVSLLALNVIFVNSVSAKDESTDSASPSAQVPEVNSYELFWPLSAGKTVSDPLYKLKLLKEKVRGLLIFGKLQKTDYGVMISTKRLLEIEKLASDNKNEEALKTFGHLEKSLEEARKNLEAAKEKDQKNTNSEVSIRTRLSNIDKFITYLLAKITTSELKSKLGETQMKIKDLQYLLK